MSDNKSSTSETQYSRFIMLYITNNTLLTNNMVAYPSNSWVSYWYLWTPAGLKRRSPHGFVTVFLVPTFFVPRPAWVCIL